MAIQDWVYELTDQRRLPDGLLFFEYAVWESQAAKDASHRPLYLNSHRAMIRETHQRVRRDPITRELLHVSGAKVAEDDALGFITGDTRGHRWVSKRGSGATRRWVDDQARELAPYIFPNYFGTNKELDPQWQREPVVIPEQAQVDEAIKRFMLRAERVAQSKFGKSLGSDWTADFRGTTLNLQVAASSDDAFQLTTDEVRIDVTNAIVDHTEEHGGNRFPGATIPQGATIDSAFFSIRISGGTGFNDDPQHQLRGEAADNAATFTTATNSIDARPRTSATVQWNSTGLMHGTEFWEWGSAVGDPTGGADIKTIIQEIVDRAGWVSGNAIVLIYEQHTLDSGRDLGQLFYDGDSSWGAKLDIDYSTPPPPTTLTPDPVVVQAAVPGVTITQTTRHYARNTQTNGGTGGSGLGAIYDLATGVGAGETVGTGSHQNDVFVVAFEFQLDVDDTISDDSFPVSLNVSAMSPNTEGRMRVQRVNSSNVVQASSAYSAVWTAIGIQTETLTLTTTWAAGDRLRLSVEHRRASGGGNRSMDATMDGDSYVDAYLSVGIELTPDPVVLTGVLPSVAVNQARTLSPDPVVVPLAVPTPGVTHALTLALDPVVTPVALPDPVIASQLTISPDPAAVSALLPSVTVAVTQVISPDPVVTQLVPADPVITSRLTISPDPIVTPLVLTDPAITHALTVTPDPVVTQAVLPAPTVSAARTLAPDPVLIPVSLPDPAITAALTVTPDPAVTPVLIPDPALTQALTITPDAGVTSLALPDPSVASTLTISPDAVVIQSALPDPAITPLLTISPDALATLLAVPNASVTQADVDRTLTPDPVVMPLLLTDGSITSALTLTPDALATPLALPDPLLTLAHELSPDPVVAQAGIPDPTITQAQTVIPDPVVIVGVLPDPSLTFQLSIAPDPAIIATALPDPSLTAGALVLSPDPLAIPILLPDPEIGFPGSLAPTPIVVTVIIPTPIITTHAAIILLADGCYLLTDGVDWLLLKYGEVVDVAVMPTRTGDAVAASGSYNEWDN